MAERSTIVVFLDTGEGGEDAGAARILTTVPAKGEVILVGGIPHYIHERVWQWDSSGRVRVTLHASRQEGRL